MFEPTKLPRLFSTPIGVDFGAALVDGLEARLKGAPPEAWGRVTIFVNSTRMRRHLLTRFAAGPARLLPSIRLVTDISADARLTGIDPGKSSLRLRLELRQAVARLIDLQPDLASHAAAFDLATSLAALLDEMQTEGVAPEALHSLDLGDHSAHWARSLKLISILTDNVSGFRGAAAVNRDALASLLARWKASPPPDPIIVAGSTGSRGTTRELMQAVARLPQGAVILPGVDCEMPAEIWQVLLASTSQSTPEEDHPQFRFAALLASLGLQPSDLASWSAMASAAPLRNGLMSLALRPAPVTDQWRRDGPPMGPALPEATATLSLIEAATPRHEAAAIALALRKAVDGGKKAALVTPDRTLARQVSAALDRWGILADDSAGLPLHQSPPGRLLVETAALFGRPPDLAPALSLLKHPLTASSKGARGPHLLHVGRFEVWARRQGAPRLDTRTLANWVAHEADSSGQAQAWADWVAALLLPLQSASEESVTQRLSRHLELAEALAAGAGQTGAGALWQKGAGETASAAMEQLGEAAPFAGIVENRDYSSLIRSFLSEMEVRETLIAHPQVMIWGTIEARTEAVDLCILAGLNEGTWPGSLPQDPWMNRTMRREAGMLAPERQVGLSAHDFQQAAGAAEVILSRSARSAEAETVPSRWLNRLTNLLEGLGQPGQEALAAMRERGRELLDQSAELARWSPSAPPNLSAPRPSPAPPATHRPRRLFVTAISTLIRDPYAIYARYILGLSRLGQRAPGPDAALRGTVLHKVMEQCLRSGFGFSGPLDQTIAGFLALAETVMAEHVPWPATRRLWMGQLAASTPDLVAIEAALQVAGTPVVIEEKGSVSLENAAFTVLAKPDRIDRLNAGGCAVFDYKSSTTPPSSPEIEAFDKQLLIEAAIAEAGGFAALGPRPATRIGYISIGNPARSRDEPLDVDGIWRPHSMLQELAALIRCYDDPDKGYTARRAPQFLKYASDYDHLSRYGEWDDSSIPESIEVGR